MARPRSEGSLPGLVRRDSMRPALRRTSAAPEGLDPSGIRVEEAGSSHASPRSASPTLQRRSPMPGLQRASILDRKSVVAAAAPPKPWKAHEETWTESVACPWLPRAFYNLRWWIMRHNPLCWYPPKGPYTYGEWLLAAGILALTALYCARMYDADVQLSGTYASIALAVTFALAAHNNLLLLIFLGLPFERTLIWHKLCASATAVMGIVHMVAFYVYGIDDEDEVEVQPDPAPESHHYFDISVATGMAITGWLMLGGIILLLAFAVPYMRRRLFAVFYRAHVTLAAVVAIGALLHGSGAAMARGDTPIGLLGGFVWIIDLGVRLIYMVGLRNPRRVSILLVADKTSGGAVVEVSFPRGDFAYSPGQYVFLCLPKLGLMHWHPFSISSSPHHSRVTLHIKAVGPWTLRLAEIARKAAETSKDGIAWERAWVEGPYGAPMVDVHGDAYKMVLLVGGGMGATPMLSFAGHLLEQSKRGRDIHGVSFVWALKASNAAEMTGIVGDAFGPNAGHASWLYGFEVPEHCHLAATVYMTGHRAGTPADHEAFVVTAGKPADGEGVSGSGDGDTTEERSGRPALARQSALSDALSVGSVATEMPGPPGLARASMAADSFQSTPAIVHSRPDFTRVMADLKRRALAAEASPAAHVRRVAVLACGPPVLLNKVRRACRKHSDSQVAFDFHHETFQY